MPLLSGSSQDVINFNTRKLIEEGYPPDQASAIAHHHAREQRHDEGHARTVAHVQARMAMAQLTGNRKRRKRIPRQQPPLAIEADYARELVAIVNSTKPAIDQLLAEMPGLLQSARHDADRADDFELRRIRTLLDTARKALHGAMRVGVLEALTRRYARAVSAFQKGQLARQVVAALGVDIATHDQRVPVLVEHFVHENVALVQSLGNQSLGDIEKIVTRAFTSGHRAESIAVEIADRYGVHERHARLIARDQIGAINGAVNVARQQELGIHEWRWRTVHDRRVRPTHTRFERQSEDKPFSDANPPLEDGSPVFPGQPVLCRCYREPVFDSLLAAAGV